MEYHDVIHGTVQIPENIQTIIKTPLFQRLKKIKQLGISFQGYNRYEHCIGTYILAERTINAVERNTKNLVIPDLYKNAVSIAALLHDVGHGPFSHTWENICCGQYHHEENAKHCIDEIFDNNSKEWNLAYLKELITNLIVGDSSCLRDQKYRFIFEILHNEQCNVDVDKWDYLQRDYYYTKHLNLLPNKVDLDFESVFMNARASSDGAHIEYRYCDFNKIYKLFETRTAFHINIYQIPSNMCLEQIFKHVMSVSENYLGTIDGLNVKEIRSKDVSAYLKLNDDEIWRLLKELKSPEEIVQLVKCLEHAAITQIFPETDDEKQAVPNYLKVENRIANAGEELKSERIIFYGNQEEKPVFEQKKGFHTSVTYFQLNV